MSIVMLGAALSIGAAPLADDVTLERVTALAQTFFRDSAEVPMNVAVTTVVTNSSGKVTHRGESTVHMVFNGYNRQAGKFSMQSNSGIFGRGSLRDSISGDLAAFFAGGILLKQDPTRAVEIQQPSAPGKPALALITSKSCPALELIPRWMAPIRPCGISKMELTEDSHGELVFERYTFDSSGASNAAKLAYLGDVKLLSYHAAVTFQKGFLPHDTKPFLWPKQTVITIRTDKGVISITNRYSPKS